MSLQSASKGSNEQLALAIFNKCITAKASNSTHKFETFLFLAKTSPSMRAHSSVITLLKFPKFRALPLDVWNFDCVNINDRL